MGNGYSHTPGVVIVLESFTPYRGQYAQHRLQAGEIYEGIVVKHYGKPVGFEVADKSLAFGGTGRRFPRPGTSPGTEYTTDEFFERRTVWRELTPLELLAMAAE